MTKEQRYAQRMKEQGNTLARIWVPVERLQELKAISAKMREQHKPKSVE